MRDTRLPLEGLARGMRRLDRDEAHYLLKVRRLGDGDLVTAFDPETGLEAAGRLRCSEQGRAELELDEPTPSAPLPPPEITLVQCVGKGDKLDQVARDATELGVSRIAPAIALRSVARRDSAQAHARLRRVVVEASRQCGRGRAPVVEPTRPLTDALAACTDARRFVLHPAATLTLGARLGAVAELGTVALVVGPEGGFDDEELRLAEGLGFEVVCLGPLVLRTETVAAAVLGALRVLAQR